MTKIQREGGFFIAKIHHLAGRIFARKLKEHHLDEINPSQGRILFVLWQNDDISIQELANRTSLGKSTLTSMLDRLEKAGYLTRILSREDRRETLIKLTAKTKVLHEVYVQVSNEMTELFYSGFGTAEINDFESYLRRIFSNLTAFEKK
ncbi:MAG: MarR family transcriptional regulator [Clostridia bacterium]|nr:MarR family transcriptional regulator [Clostridia bacterium]